MLITLLERSGLLREPETDRIDFIHRTFQEYLAAQAALNHDDVGLLVDHAADDQWHQTIVLAVGLSTPTQRNTLISSLLDPPRRLRTKQGVLDIVALASMETAGDLSDAHAREIVRRAKYLLPPSQPEHVTQLAAAGDLALGLIDVGKIGTAVHAKNTARLAALVGSETGLAMVEQLAHDSALLSMSDLVGLWEYFDPDDYVRRVLSGAGRVVRSLELASSTMTRTLDLLPGLAELDCNFSEPWDDYSFLERLAALRSARIGVPFGSPRLTVGVPPALENVTIASQRGLAKNREMTRRKDGAARSTPGLSLKIAGLDATRVLDRLTIGGVIRRLEINDDPRLQSLRHLALPATLVELAVTGCRQLRSLAGLESADLPCLQLLDFSLQRNAHLDVSALLAPRDVRPPIIGQLTRVSVTSGDIGDLVYQLSDSGMRLDARSDSASWTRPAEQA